MPVNRSDEVLAAVIQYDPDFVALKRYEYSLAKMLEKYPDECPDHVIAAALQIPEESVQEEYERIVAKLRLLMNVG